MLCCSSLPINRRPWPHPLSLPPQCRRPSPASPSSAPGAAMTKQQLGLRACANGEKGCVGEEDGKSMVVPPSACRGALATCAHGLAGGRCPLLPSVLCCRRRSVRAFWRKKKTPLGLWRVGPRQGKGVSKFQIFAISSQIHISSFRAPKIVKPVLLASLWNALTLGSICWYVLVEKFFCRNSYLKTGLERKWTCFSP
jgi:hypothetical protein